MYELTVKESFSSAHRLRHYRGRCENLHGHNWKVEVKLKGGVLDRTGLLYDFTDIKKTLRVITSGLDHAYLNRIGCFSRSNPTSENIAKYIYDKMKLKVKKTGVKITAVTVWESDNCSASYSEDNF